MYDGERIFRNGDVISENWKFNLGTNRPILKAPFAVFYERRKKGAVFLKKAESMKFA
jgi:hypothetical protein